MPAAGWACAQDLLTVLACCCSVALPFLLLCCPALPAAVCLQIQVAEGQTGEAQTQLETSEAECGRLRRDLAAAEGRLSLVDSLEAEAAEAKERASLAEQQAGELADRLRAALVEADEKSAAVEGLTAQVEEARAAAAAATAAAEEAAAQRCACRPHLAVRCSAASHSGACLALHLAPKLGQLPSHLHTPALQAATDCSSPACRALLSGLAAAAGSCRMVTRRSRRRRHCALGWSSSWQRLLSAGRRRSGG